jgi:tetratricopeptide (TPR) repeat protein
MSESTVNNKKIKTKIEKMYRSGNVNNAIELCKDTLKLHPTDAELRMQLGDFYLDKHLDVYQAKQSVDDAITEYQRAHECNLDSPLIYYKIGVALYYKGEYDKALGHFNLCLEHDETMFEAYYMIAKCHVKKERFAEAQIQVQKAINYSKYKSSRAFFLNFALLKNKNEKNLKNFFQASFYLYLSIFLLPFDKEAKKDFLRKLSYLNFFPFIIKAYYLERTKKHYKAIELYNAAIEKAPGFMYLYIALGDLYRITGKTSDAINEYRMALLIDPSNVNAYKALCSIYEELGDYDNAILTYQKLIDMHSNDAVYYSNLANIYYLKGELKEAISCYQTAITLNPNKAWTSVIAQTLGYVLQESKENYDAAISAYQSASLLNPNDIDIYVSLGSAFYDKGDYNNALSAYRVALEIDPNNARIHCNLGYLLWGKGLLDEAIKEYEIAINLDPSYDIVYNNLGVIYLDDLSRIQKAVELFEEAIKYNPNYALAYYNIGRAMAMKNDKIEAAKYYQIALDLNSFTKELDPNEVKAKIDGLFD